MIKKLCALCSLVTLTACGGSSTSVVPFGVAGFAQSGGELDGPYSFILPDQVRLLGDGEDNQSLEEQEVRITGTVGEGDITVVIDGVTYVLTRDPSNANVAEYRDGDDVVILQTIIIASDYAIGLELFSVIEDKLNAGNLVAGFDTDPAQIASETGNADFEGFVRATLRNGFDDAFGEGRFSLTVDFDAGTLSGTALVEDLEDTNADFTFDAVTINIEEGPITGNSFAGDVSLALGDLGGTLEDATYSGRFFGPEGEDIGGQFSGRIDLDDIERDTLVEGIFLGNKDDT